MAIRYSIFIVVSVITLGAIILLAMALKPYREARDTLTRWGEQQGQPG